MRKAMIANALYRIRTVRGILKINGVQVESHVDHETGIITIADGGSRREAIARGVRAGLEAAMTMPAVPVWSGDIEPTDGLLPGRVPFSPDQPN